MNVRYLKVHTPLTNPKELLQSYLKGETKAYNEKYTEYEVHEVPSISTFGKYKPVAQKVRPQYAELDKEFRIVREIKGDTLENMPTLSPNPPEFTYGVIY